MKCQVCNTDIEQNEVSQYAAYGGLPSPCCKLCFNTNDYSITSIEKLAAKSLLKRAQNLAKID